MANHRSRGNRSQQAPAPSTVPVVESVDVSVSAMEPAVAPVTTEPVTAEPESAPVPAPALQRESMDDQAPVTAPAPRLEACYFNQTSDGRYGRLARVLAISATARCAGWDVHVRELAPVPVLGARQASHVHNVAKVEHWASIVAAAADGDRLMLTDADVVILRSLDDVWDTPFDVAYTVRPETSRYRFNAGVICLRVNARSRAFMQQWLDENRTMLRDAAYHEVWRRQYGGINQASLGALMATWSGWSELLVQTLPCAEWNCEDMTWAAFDPSVTRILHIKGALRAKIFGTSDADPDLHVDRLATLWRALERQAAR